MTQYDVQITPGTGVSIAADVINDDTLGANTYVQYVKLIDGNISGTNKGGISSIGMKTDGTGFTQPMTADSSVMINGANSVTPQFATFGVSASGANTIITGIASKHIRVLALAISANAAVAVKWQSHTTPTDITGLLTCAASGDGEVLPFNPIGWFQTLSGEALDINLSAGSVYVGGHITYIVV